ncbi:MAG: single-stranded-DNA-specific exonuclease RecJ [Armatimonadetes bacterium]|nr:single-stranded-DNA-specific exonuclease RecJ [Armatimonadota bacterium]
MARPHWRRAPDQREGAREVSRVHSLHPVVAHALLNRGVQPEGVGEFLRPTKASLGDPALLADLDRAAERLARAVTERQKVCIYGDYDADGTTAGALMSRFLARREVPHSYYVPNRFAEGYGVNEEAIGQLLREERPKLLITVDCGIGSAETLDALAAFGVDAVVTDHHQVPERLPKAPAVNPHRADSTYPFRELCGAAVAYKVCLRTAELLGEGIPTDAAELLELVAVGTIADVMPLVGENRFYAWHGLRRLGRSVIPGVRALLETARLGEGGVSARDVAFGIGPRLNAAGRMDSARDAWQLLVTADQGEARRLAETLERHNRERKEVEERIAAEAFEQIRSVSLHDTWGLVVSGQGWHEGVIGLVAQRLCHTHHRPVLAVSTDGDAARGSGRSPEPLDLYAALGECAELLGEFGGHPRAAGFSLAASNVAALAERFNQVVRARLTEADLTPSLTVECRVKANSLTLELAKELEKLAPFGEGNREPVLEVDGLRVGEAKATRDGTHLQVTFLMPGRNGTGEARLKGFWPRMGRYAERLEAGREVTVAGHLHVDAWQGREQPQLLVEDLRVGWGVGSEA